MLRQCTAPRYAMVVYGGDEDFAQPVVATVNNQIFTDAENIHKALDHVTFSEYCPWCTCMHPHTFTHTHNVITINNITRSRCAFPDDF